MVIIETAGSSGPPEHTVWSYKEFFWGRVHGWLHPDGLRAAIVAGGLDSFESFERAEALIRRLPVDGLHRRILDREAVRLRELDHQLWEEDEHGLRGTDDAAAEAALDARVRASSLGDYECEVDG